MKRFTFLSLAFLCMATVGWANIIVTNESVVGSGPCTWTYLATLSSDQKIAAGPAPAGLTVSPDDLLTAGLFTIYDFAGYISGSCTGPAGWICIEQNTGITPSDVTPVDNPTIVNLTWYYASGPTISGDPVTNTGVALGQFRADSILSISVASNFAARGIKNNGPAIDTITDNIGLVGTPLTSGMDEVPEPSTLLICGLGLAAIGLARRRMS